MAARRIVDSAVHLHWAFKARTAQLRLARVTFEPERWAGACRVSRDVCYVRFLARGDIQCTFAYGGLLPEKSTERDVHVSHTQVWLAPALGKGCAVALEEIEQQFQAGLALRRMLGLEHPDIDSIGEWSTSRAIPCERCPSIVRERFELFQETRR